MSYHACTHFLGTLSMYVCYLESRISMQELWYSVTEGTHINSLGILSTLWFCRILILLDFMMQSIALTGLTRILTILLWLMILCRYYVTWLMWKRMGVGFAPICWACRFFLFLSGILVTLVWLSVYVTLVIITMVSVLDLLLTLAWWYNIVSPWTLGWDMSHNWRARSRCIESNSSLYILW